MKNTLYLLAIIAFAFACSAPKQEAEEPAEPEEESIYSYTGSFEMGDPANQTLVRDMLSAFASNDMETMTSYFADSVSFYFANGDEYENVKDSAMAMVSQYRSSLTSVNIMHLAGMTLKSKDHGHDWSLTWTMETHSNEEGDEAAVYQENWLIDENGKIRAMRQFMQMPNEADAGGSEPEEGGYAYSGSFTMADPALVDIVIGLEESVASLNDMDGMAAAFADSVTIIGHDGFYFNATNDSLMSMAEKWLSGYTSISRDYIASVAVTSDRDEDWVLLWFESESVNKEGETRKAVYHNDYLIQDGKVRFIRGYKRGDWDNKEEEAEEGSES